MFSFALIPLGAALVIAFGIIYYCFPRGVIDVSGLMRLVRPSVASGPSGAPSNGEAEEMLRKEVSKVRKLAAELNKGRLDMEWSERRLEEKSKKLDMLIAKAEQTLSTAASADAGARDDNYSKAGMLLELGLPAGEVESRLGLLRGELELIERLESYRWDNAAGAQKRKKAPHREHPSHAVGRARMHGAGHVA